MKRGRNQRRRQGVNPNRALDSNGPDVRIRGTAQQIYDKYQALARDSASSGDRVKAENYLQHAEHYFRVLRSLQGPQQQQQQQTYDQSQNDSDVDGDQPSIGEPREQRHNAANGDDDSESKDAAESSENAAETEKSARRKDGADENNGADNDGEAKPRRRRRPRRPREEDSGETEDQPDTAPAS